MEVVVVENIYLLVMVTLISVLQNGEEQPPWRSAQCLQCLELVGVLNGGVIFSLLCPESGEGMQQSNQQSTSFWKSFLCQVRVSLLISSLIYDTRICLFYDLFYVSYTFLEKLTHLANKGCFFFFIIFYIFLCNMLACLLQLIATALTGWLSQCAWTSVFPFSLCEQKAADAGSHRPHEFMCFGFVNGHNILGGDAFKHPV